MHSTYTSLFFPHDNGPNLIKQHFYLTTDLIARFDTSLLCWTQLNPNTQYLKRQHWFGLLMLFPQRIQFK